MAGKGIEKGFSKNMSVGFFVVVILTTVFLD